MRTIFEVLQSVRNFSGHTLSALQLLSSLITCILMMRVIITFEYEICVSHVFWPVLNYFL